MIKKIFIKLTILFASVSFPLCSQEMIPPDLMCKLDNYMAKEIPGMALSYEEILTTLMSEGYNVYLIGGIFRDLFDGRNTPPRDIDLQVDATPEQLQTLCQKKGWMYTNPPDCPIFYIGNPLGKALEIQQVRWINEKETDREFTANGLLYHLNKKEFIGASETKLNDLFHHRIQLTTNDWEAWLYSSKRKVNYFKIFRFWKMVGKSYIYTSEQEQFFYHKVTKLHTNDPALFSQQIKKYLSRHFDSWNEVIAGARTLMGWDWTEKNVGCYYKEIHNMFEEREQELLQYTVQGDWKAIHVQNSEKK